MNKKKTTAKEKAEVEEAEVESENADEHDDKAEE